MPKLAVGLDFQDRASCLRALEQLGDLPVVFKFGLRLLPLLTLKDFESFRDAKLSFFVDAKLHDIPSQVAGAVRTWSELGASYLTLHLSGGRTMLREACQARGPGLRLLGVSLLTSMDESDLSDLGISGSTTTIVERWTTLAESEGIHSFVCSVSEAAAIRARSSDAFLCTPGLTLPGDAPHADQRRTATLKQAVAAGSNLLVVARSIIHAPDPRARAVEALAQLKEQS
jgi:orotidine-5'-phosphate decarboxylase